MSIFLMYLNRLSKQHVLGGLDKFLEFLAPLGGDCSIHYSMVRAQRHIHDMCDPRK